MVWFELKENRELHEICSVSTVIGVQIHFETVDKKTKLLPIWTISVPFLFELDHFYRFFISDGMKNCWFHGCYLILFWTDIGDFECDNFKAEFVSAWVS